GSEGGEQRYCSPTPIGKDVARHAREAWTPASAGATEIGISFPWILRHSIPWSSRRRLTELSTSSSRRRPGSSQRRGAPCARMPGLRPSPERRRLGSRFLGSCDTQYLVVPA